MAGVAQLVELWIVSPMFLSNINYLTQKCVRTFADKLQTNRKEIHGKI